MDKFGYPTNVKQIGDVDDSLRIYIEDYVYSYLLQYAEAGGDEERIAALIGRCMIIDGQTVLFVNGAIQGKYSEQEKGVLVFNQKSFDYIENQCEKYFKGLEVVGWMQSQPNYGNFLSASYANYHISNFKKPYQVMLVTDPVEKINSFFIWNEDRTDIEESKGFFIYYDKNKSMHNYILDNKIVKLKQSDNFIPAKTITLKKDVDIENDISDDEETDQGPIILGNRRSIMKNVKNSRKKIGAKPTSVIASVCALLFVVSFAMGTGLVKNNHRISTLEGQINNIRTAYNGLVTYINENGTKSVFASSTQPIANENIPQTPQNSANLATQSTDQALGNEAQTQVVVEPTDETPAPTPAPTTTPTPTPTPAPKPKSTTAPKPKPTKVVPDIPETYVIQSGDSLSDISIKFYGNTDMETAIMNANQITDPDKIFFGMVIKLPKN